MQRGLRKILFLSDISLNVEDDKCSPVICPTHPIGAPPDYNIMYCDCTTIVNEATTQNTHNLKVTGTAPDGSTVEAASTISFDVVHPSIKITKTADPLSVMVGVPTEVTYTYDITNTGDTELDISELIDDELGSIITGCTKTEGIVPSESVICTATKTIDSYNILDDNKIAYGAF